MKLFKEGKKEDYYQEKGKTVRNGRCSKEEFRKKFGTPTTPQKKKPKSYMMVNGVPHRYNKDGKLVPLKRVS